MTRAGKKNVMGMFLFSHKTKEEHVVNFLRSPLVCGNMHALDFFNLKDWIQYIIYSQIPNS